MRSTNPALSDNTLSNVEVYSNVEPMTVQGTINKTFVLLGLLVASAAWIWSKMSVPADTLLQEQHSVLNNVGPFMTAGLIGGLVAALVTIFKKSWASITAPFYALCEGLVLGGMSAIMEMKYPGIAIQAVGLTFATMFSMLALYKSGLIKVTDRFRTGLFAATGAVCLVYLFSMILGFFGRSLPFIHDTGVVGIGFSLVVVGIAAFNLILDFDLIERAAFRRLPKYMEWYSAFALMVTLVWLYMEILRLLSKFRDRR